MAKVRAAGTERLDVYKVTLRCPRGFSRLFGFSRLGILKPMHVSKTNMQSASSASTTCKGERVHLSSVVLEFY